MYHAAKPIAAEPVAAKPVAAAGLPAAHRLNSDSAADANRRCGGLNVRPRPRKRNRFASQLTVAILA